MKIKNERGFSMVLVVAVMAFTVIAGSAFYVVASNTRQNNSGAGEQSISQSADEQSANETAEVAKDDVRQGKVITAGDSEFGTILFDSNNQAIYIWELEEAQTAECYGDCAEAWPPVLTDGDPIAGGTVQGELLGTTLRTDGTTQVTYNGHPLYYYAHEEAGDVKCHNISTHGGLWWVIRPDGARA